MLFMSFGILLIGYDSPKDEEGGTDGEERSAPPRRYRPRRRYEYGGYRGGRGGGRGGGGGHTSGDEVKYLLYILACPAFISF